MMKSKMTKLDKTKELFGALACLAVVYVACMAFSTATPHKPQKPVKKGVSASQRQADVWARDVKTGKRYNLSKGEKPEWMEE